MKKVLFALILLIILSGCTRYGGDSYNIARRGNIKLYDGSKIRTRIIRNNIWSVSKFLSGILPRQKNIYEVYITDKRIIELLAEEDFIQHVLDRINANKTYDDKEREKASLLTTTDLRDLFEKPETLDGQSMYIIPVADIIILKNDENYGKKFFLYSYVSLMLYDNNPDYYLNESKSREDYQDALLFRFLLSGFPSLYSRYFSKYPGRDPSAKLYLMLADIDIKYLEDIYNLDVSRFGMIDDTRLAGSDEAVVYYAYFFKYLFETLDDAAVLEIIESLFKADENRSSDLRRLYSDWKNQL